MQPTFLSSIICRHLGSLDASVFSHIGEDGTFPPLTPLFDGTPFALVPSLMETIPESQIARDPFIALISSSGEVSIEEKPVSDGRQFIVKVKPPVEPAPVSAVSSDQNEALSKPYMLENALLLMKSGDYVLARNLYSFLLKQDLRDEESLKGLGTCLLRLGDVTSARRCFTALWELYRRESALIFLSQCAIAEKNDPQALELLERIKSPSFLPKSERYEYYREIGNCLTRSGQFERAEKAYAEALNLNPSNDATYVNFGTLEIQRERFDLALFYFRRALQLNPKNARAHCGIGITAVAVNDLDRAKRSFIEALEIDPHNVVALHQLAALCEVLSLDSEVTHRIQNYLKTEPRNHELRFTLAALWYRQNEWLASERELEIILKTDPSHEKALRLRQELIQNRHRY